jgi:hypothetical protein
LVSLALFAAKKSHTSQSACPYLTVDAL